MCTPALELNFRDTTSFNSWKATQAAQIDSAAAVSVPSQREVVEIQQLTQNLNSAYTCVNSKLQTARTVQTDNADLESRIANMDKTIEERKKDVGVAKDRAAIARDPSQSRSYYDGWFPIQRPLKHFTIPVLIGISLFLLMMAFFYLMSLVGIDTRILVRAPVNSISSAGQSQFTGAFWGATGISVILLGLTLYAFLRK